MSSVTIIESPEEMFRWTRQQQANQKVVGLVPTMGALHEGHLSLAKAARQHCDRVVVTIFVNPTQFGPHEDFERYPRNLSADVELLEALGVDCVFAPSVEAMYPEGSTTSVAPPSVAKPLEGECRPGHFEGVCTVVLKLFQIIPADLACFGQKDFQQALVIQHMARDLNVGTRIQICPTLREPDGLAMSSRNAYLKEADRERALCLSRALRRVGVELSRGVRSPVQIEQAMKSELSPYVDQLDYAVVVDPETLECPPSIAGPVVGLIAVHVGGTRLIDNSVYSVTGESTYPI